LQRVFLPEVLLGNKRELKKTKKQLPSVKQLVASVKKCLLYRNIDEKNKSFNPKVDSLDYG
jgi:hypothetical protein